MARRRHDTPSPPPFPGRRRHDTPSPSPPADRTHRSRRYHTTSTTTHKRSRISPPSPARRSSRSPSGDSSSNNSNSSINSIHGKNSSADIMKRAKKKEKTKKERKKKDKKKKNKTEKNSANGRRDETIREGEDTHGQQQLGSGGVVNTAGGGGGEEGTYLPSGNGNIHDFSAESRKETNDDHDRVGTHECTGSASIDANSPNPTAGMREAHPINNNDNLKQTTLLEHDNGVVDEDAPTPPASPRENPPKQSLMTVTTVATDTKTAASAIDSVDEDAPTPPGSPSNVALGQQDQQLVSSPSPAVATGKTSFFAQLHAMERKKGTVGTMHATGGGGLGGGAGAPIKSSDWECQKCGKSNYKNASACDRCHALKRMTLWRD